MTIGWQVFFPNGRGACLADGQMLEEASAPLRLEGSVPLRNGPACQWLTIEAR